MSKIVDEIMAYIEEFQSDVVQGLYDEDDYPAKAKLRAMVEDAVSLPSGMVLVPIELTAEMATAMFMKANLTIPERYKAMLSASPCHSEIEDLPELLKPQSPEY
jgi:hypothetical protein